jgi:glycosyltransferase involved in cell wall biosynthesis
MITFLNLAAHPWGAEESMLLLADGLAARGTLTELVCSSPELAEKWERVGNGPARLIAVGSGDGRWSHNATSFRIVRTMPEARDVVLWTYDALPGAVAGRRLRPDLRLILDLHDRIRGRRGQALMRRFSRSCDAIVTNSKFTGEFIADLAPVPIYRPVQRLPAQTDEPSNGRRPFRVGLIGRLEPRKEAELAILAVAAVGPSVHLVVRGGSDPSESAYRDRLQLMASAVAPGQTTFEGRVPRESAIGGIDVLLVASSVEAMGRTVIEAQVAGIPVVVPDEGGASELVIDHKTGLKFKARDSSSLARVLRRIRDDTALYRRLRMVRPDQIVGLDPAAYASAYAQVVDQARA